MKIRAKLSLTYLTVSLLALPCMSAFIYFYEKNTITSEQLSHLESVSSIQSHRVESLIEQNLERIRLVSSRTQLRISLDNYLKNSDSNHLEKINRILNDAMTSIESFRVISILNKDGLVVASTSPVRLGKNYSQLEFYKTAHSKNTADHFFLDSNSRLKLYLSGPLKIGNKFLGILLIESDAQNIVSLLSDYSGLGQTGETVLGRLHTNGNYAQYLAPLRFDEHAAMQRIVDLNRHSNPMVMALANKKQFLGSGIDYRNHEVLVATDYIASTNWGLVVKIDQEEAFSPINDLLKYILFISLSLLLAVAWVSFLLAKVISNPIVELTNAAHEIDQGNLNKRAEIKSNDEVGELARTFNNMADGLIRTQHDLKDSNDALQSHHEHLEELVAQRTKEIEEKSKELESFSYSVSHDLRSPLRAIDGFSKILIDDYEEALDDEGKRYFRRIRQACQRMGDLIDDLLELSRVNRSDFDLKDINLSVKANTAIERLEPNLPDHEVEFVVQPDLHVRGDDTLMEIVMFNLISNAWKYSATDRPIKIEVGKTIKDGETVYFVRDNGIGFEMKYSNKLFKVFERLVTNDEYPGTGIGLATVSRIINRHGGRIWAESEPDKGATFYFTLQPKQN